MLKSAAASVVLALLCAACGGGGGGGDGGSKGIGVKDLNGDGQVVILCFGDSITFGIGDGDKADQNPSNGGYPLRLQALLGVPVVNAGRPGERTFQGVKRLPVILGRNQADYVILLEGVNDIEFGDGKTLDNFQRMVDSVVGSGALPIVGTLTPTCCQHIHAASPAHVGRLNAALLDIATANAIPVIDFHSAFVLGPEDPADETTDLIHEPEGLHPTPAGYDVMALAAEAAFLGKKPPTPAPPVP